MTKMQNDHDEKTEQAPQQELTETELGNVAGGVANNQGTVSNDHEIVSPRDPASGLPTGKRMHKPITVTSNLG